MGLKSKLMSAADKTPSLKSKSVALKVMLPLLLIEFAIAIAWGWMRGSYEGLHFGGWQIAEWLINYQAGFVRRGLAGQTIFLLGNGRNLLQILYAVTLYFYISYAAIFVALYFFARVNNVKVLILAILIPGSLFQMGMTIQFFTRKEILFLILFGLLCLQYLWILHSRCLNSEKRIKYLPSQLFCLYAMAIVGGSLMTLVHEGYLFMSYPLTLLLLWLAKKESPHNAISTWGLVLYMLCVPILFIVCAINRGDPIVAQIVWESLSLDDRIHLAGVAPYTAFGPIASLGWGMQQNLLTIYGMFVTGGWKLWLLYMAGNGMILGYIANAIDGSGSATHSRYLRLVLLGLIVSSGMFIIAADWGRWIAYVGNSLLLWMFVLKQSTYAQGAIQGVPERLGFQWPTCLREFFTSPILFWFTLVYALSFRLPECCVNPDFLFMPYNRIFGGL